VSIIQKNIHNIEFWNALPYNKTSSNFWKDKDYRDKKKLMLKFVS
jgi:hypothetical protein